VIAKEGAQDDDAGLRTTRIAILKTGAPPPALEARFGSYPDMLAALLAGAARRFTDFDATHGDFPAQDYYDALIITGSPAGVHDALPWIEPLKAFLRQARGTPMIGVCFGHQIMAEAFGGRVEKSHKGWGLGLHRYEVTASESWMHGAADAFTIAASHQDQVVAAPRGARVAAASVFTPIAALAYADHPAISFQGHPEFSPAFAEALVRARRGHAFDAALADSAIDSLGGAHDREKVGGWIVRFLEGALPSGG
jgi:GMP synthase-like glutamine amidotransferase